jgi:hypothetical protein
MTMAPHLWPLDPAQVGKNYKKRHPAEPTLPNGFIWATWTAAGSEYLERPTPLPRLMTACSTTRAVSAHDERGTRGRCRRRTRNRTAFRLRSPGYLAHLRDPLAAVVALEEGPQRVATRAAAVDVELRGALTRCVTVTDWSGRWG